MNSFYSDPAIKRTKLSKYCLIPESAYLKCDFVNFPAALLPKKAGFVIWWLILAMLCFCAKRKLTRQVEIN